MRDENADTHDSKIPVANTEGSLKSAARHTYGGTPAAPDHDATERERAARIEAEQSRLIQWAKINCKLEGKLPPEDARGGEHTVYFNERLSRYFKSTIPEKHKGYGIALGSFTHGATPAEYLDRLSLQNRIFNDDICLEYIVLWNAKPIIVTSQPFISGEYADQESLDNMMLEHGFEKLISGAYYDSDESLLMFDLFPKNAKIDANGIICPFDPVVQRIAPDFADFLRHFPDRIHNR